MPKSLLDLFTSSPFVSYNRLMKKLFKNDSYKKSRGGYSRLLEISCTLCNTIVCRYQKDGPGILKRMYLDRISSSEKYAGLAMMSLKDIQNLTCPKCSEILGVPMIYKKEDRTAYRLFVGSVAKKIIKSV